MAQSLALAFDILARDKASTVLDKVGDSADDVGGKLEGLSTKAKVGFAGVAGAAALAGAAVGDAFFSALDIGKGEDKLAAQLGLSPEQSAAFGKAAGDLYADAYGDSMGQVNEALGAVQSTIGDALGPADDALSTASAHALDLASAFDIDVTDAVNRAGSLLSQGLAADADEAFDLVTASMQRMSPALRDELGEATTEYGRFFSGFGISGAEMLDLFSQADDKFALDKTGDAIKELSIRATDMSASSVDAYEAAGLNADKMAAKILAGGEDAREGLGEIIEGLLDIKDPVKQANAAIGLFGTPLEDLGTSEIPAFLESLSTMGSGLGDVAGAADRMGTTLNDNAATKIEMFKRGALQGLTDFMGGTVIPAGEELAEVFGEEGFGGVLGHLGTKISESLPGVQAAIGGLLGDLGEYLVTNAPVFGAKVQVLAGELVDWISQQAPVAFTALAGFLGEIAAWILDPGLAMLGEGVAVLIPALVDWITDDVIPKLVGTGEDEGVLYDMLLAFADWVKEDGVPGFLRGGRELGEGILRGIVEGFGDAFNLETSTLDLGPLGEYEVPLGIKGLAAGGPVTAGMPYVVGERRPELFVPDQDGRILSSVPTSSGFDAVGEDQLLELRRQNALLASIDAAVRTSGGSRGWRASAAVMG